MHDDLRWAARFAFLEELWRDRPRVVVDRGLEAWLSAGVAPEGEDDPVAALVDRLLPASGGGPRAFMATHEAATARELSRTRPATNFVAVDRLPDLLQHRDFAVAVIDLVSVDVDSDAETTAVAHSSATEVAAGRRVLGPTARRVLEQLGEAARAGKAVAIVLPAGPGPGAFDDEQAMDLLAERLGGGRLYGLYQPRMTALVDYGMPGEGERDEQGDEVDEDDDERLTVARLEPDDDLEADADLDDEVPLSFDNTLGTMAPPIEEWLIVASVDAPADGLSLLEVRDGSTPLAPPPASWRAQLSEAQRQADLQAIEVRRWIERADELEADNERLGLALAAAEDRLVRAVHAQAPATEPASGTDSELSGDPTTEPRRNGPSTGRADLQVQARLEADAAEIQALKWRIGQLEDQLQAARARPLDELEAELASLRSRLEGAGASAVPDGPDGPDGRGPQEPTPRPSTSRPGPGGPLHPVAGTHVQAAVRVLEALVQRLERGGIEAVKLRADLLALKRRLRRLQGPPGADGTAAPPVGRSGPAGAAPS